MSNVPLTVQQPGQYKLLTQDGAALDAATGTPAIGGGLVATRNGINGPPVALSHLAMTQVVVTSAPMACVAGQKVVLMAIIQIEGSDVAQTLNWIIEDDTAGQTFTGSETLRVTSFDSVTIVVEFSVGIGAVPPGNRTFNVKCQPVTDDTPQTFNSSIVAMLCGV
jgi:hypothetical protein